MDQSFQKLKEFVKMRTKHVDENGFSSLLEMLWYFHTAYYPIDNDAIDRKFAELEPILEKLSQKRKHRVLAEVIDLCVEYERAAFISGIRVGVQLVQETFEAD